MQSAVATDLPLAEVRIPLGRLAVAGDATPGIGHVQDNLTGKIVPIIVHSDLLHRYRPAGRPSRIGQWWAGMPGWARATAAAGCAALIAGLVVVGQGAMGSKSVSDLPLAKAGTPPPKTITQSVGPYEADGASTGGPVGQVAPPTVVPPPKGPEASGPILVAAPDTSVVPRNLPAARPEAPPLPSQAKPAPAPALPRPAPAPATAPAAAKPVPAPTTVAVVGGPSAPAAVKPVGPKEDNTPVVVFNEASADSARSVNAAVAIAGQPQRPAMPSPTAAPTLPTDPNVRVRLVAIKDANTILINVPGNALPQQVKPGARLPNGRTIVKADPAKGTVHLDNGTTLALE